VSSTGKQPQLAPERCDIAVVGGGIVGLAVARELTRRNPRAKPRSARIKRGTTRA